MSQQSIILFLQLEGVLYDQSNADWSVPGTNISPRAQALAKIAAPYLPQLEVVVTDYAALQLPLERFRERLPSTIAAKVIESVYLEELTNSSWSDYHSALANRHACIALWLNRRRPQYAKGWVALDAGHELDSWPSDQLHHLVRSAGHSRLQMFNVHLQRR